MQLHPEQYLREGFFTPEGTVRPGLNGECSLKMAYRLRREEIHPQGLARVRDRIAQAAERQRRRLQQSPEGVLPRTAREALSAVLAEERADASPALEELLIALAPRIQTWRDLTAAVDHVDRILKQLALISAATPPTDR